MAVIDVITYNGEIDLLELRLNILHPYVDKFYIIEFDQTFSGKKKEIQFMKYEDFNRLQKQKWWNKLHFFIQKEKDWIKYKELAENSPNTIGAEHWKREFMQKESIKDCLIHLKDDDIVFIGDCDEIWNPVWLLEIQDKLPSKLKLKVYTYYLNNKSTEVFWGTIVSGYKNIRENCLNYLRSNSNKSLRTPFARGWHFTSLKDSLAKKLTDSYTKETYASDVVMQNLEENIKNNKDFLGRNFTYTVDESDWPQYLKDNREQYKHLLK